MLLERCPYARKGMNPPGLFRYHEQGGVQGTVACCNDRESCFERALFQLLTVAFNQVDKFLLGMNAQLVVDVLDVRFRCSRRNAKAIADGFCVAALREQQQDVFLTSS